MRKFFVLFCKKNLVRPSMYLTKSSIGYKTKMNPQLQHKQFQSEIEAEKFLYPKKISYLIMKQQLLKNGFDLNPKQKTQKKPKQSKKQSKVNKKQQQQQKVQSDGQKNQSIKVEQQIQQKKQQKKDDMQKKQEILQTQTQTDKQKQKLVQQVNQKIQNEQIQKQIATKTNKYIKQIQQSIKQLSMSQISKKNLTKTYRQLLSLLGSDSTYQKSPTKKQIKPRMKYYAFFDGCSKPNPGPSGAGYLVVNSKGEKIFQRSINLGHQTNNQAEFMALVYCLMDCKANGIKKLKVHGDSQFVVRAVLGVYEVEARNLKMYEVIAGIFKRGFEEFEIMHIEREKNKVADKLSTQALKKKCLRNDKYQYL